MAGSLTSSDGFLFSIWVTAFDWHFLPREVLPPVFLEVLNCVIISDRMLSGSAPALRKPDVSEGWTIKIFLSSTYLDLVSYRQAAAEAIEHLGQQGVRMEVFGARPLEATSACFDEIGASDALVGIYAHRYGYVPPGQTVSITEREFDFVREEEKHAFCFIADEEYPWPPKHVESEPGRALLFKFKKRLQTLLITDSFTTPADLAFKVSSSLGRFLLSARLKEDLEKLPNRDNVSTELGRSQIARRLVRIENVIRGAQVLIVNDIPAEMEYVISILGKLGIDVQIETSTNSALRSLRKIFTTW